MTVASMAGKDLESLARTTGPAAFPPLGPALKVLMVWPRFEPSFWGFGGMLTFTTQKTLYPPLGPISARSPPTSSVTSRPWTPPRRRRRRRPPRDV